MKPVRLLTIATITVWLLVLILSSYGCGENSNVSPVSAPAVQTDNVPHPEYRYKITYTTFDDVTYTHEGSAIEYFNEDHEDMYHVFQSGCGISIPQVSKMVKHAKFEINGN